MVRIELPTEKTSTNKKIKKEKKDKTGRRKKKGTEEVKIHKKSKKMSPLGSILKPRRKKRRKSQMIKSLNSQWRQTLDQITSVSLLCWKRSTEELAQV